MRSCRERDPFPFMLDIIHAIDRGDPRKATYFFTMNFLLIPPGPSKSSRYREKVINFLASSCWLEFRGTSWFLPDCHTEWSKSEREKYCNINTYMWNPEKQYRWPAMQSRQRHRCREQMYGHPSGEGVVGWIGRLGLMYIYYPVQKDN